MVSEALSLNVGLTTQVHFPLVVSSAIVAARLYHLHVALALVMTLHTVVDTYASRLRVL